MPVNVGFAPLAGVFLDFVTFSCFKLDSFFAASGVGRSFESGVVVFAAGGVARSFARKAGKSALGIIVILALSPRGFSVGLPAGCKPHC